MTELKRIEQTLQQKNTELEAASRMKSEFLANMSHELRTPAQRHHGLLRGALRRPDGRDDRSAAGLIGNIFSSGQHLLALINDILDLSKVEAGKMELDLEPVQVSSLFVNSLSIIREKAAARRIRLSVDTAADLGSIQADARKVKQIVYNLLSNAVKFTARRRPGDPARRPRPRAPTSAGCPAPGRAGASRWPTAASRSFSRSASPTPASACRRRGWRACSRRSVRSTAAWRGSSRGPDSGWRW